MDQAANSFELTVTSTHSAPSGDAIVIGRDLGALLIRVVVRASAMPRLPEPGECWRVTGNWIDHPDFGSQLHAEVALPLVPQGKAIVRYLATDKRFPGVGWATAEKLWRTFGEDIYSVIQKQDFRSLAPHVGLERALAIVNGFDALNDEVEVYRALDRYGVSPVTAGAVSRLWGKDAVAKIAEDPYLLSFFESWREVDERALLLGVSLNDERRLLAAVEEAFATEFRRGHMASSEKRLISNLQQLLTTRADLAQAAMVKAEARGRFVRLPNNALQSLACNYMETEVARSLETLLRRRPIAASPADCNEIIQSACRRIHGTITELQVQAVSTAILNGVALIYGGAGTGKTTVLRAIHDVLDVMGDNSAAKRREVIQVAVAGRAARRMSQATGRTAMTLSRLNRAIDTNSLNGNVGTIIFDEASMIDTPSLFRVLSRINSDLRILFVGDTGQLPPIGAGMPFYEMVTSGIFPQVELKIVHRQKDTSGIPAIAAQIRAGVAPRLPAFRTEQPLRPGVFFHESDDDTTGSAVLDVFRAFAGAPPPRGQTSTLHQIDVQILTATKRGKAGSHVVSEAIDREYMINQKAAFDWGLKVGSKILWLKNDYEKAPERDAEGSIVVDHITGKPIFAGFMNGSLGVLKEIVSSGALVRLDDGVEDSIRADDLINLTHGWAITIHKAQGSAFRRVIIPIARMRHFDRTMLYTAITRGVETVVLVGPKSVFSQIIGAPPVASHRLKSMTFNATAARAGMN